MSVYSSWRRLVHSTLMNWVAAGLVKEDNLLPLCGYEPMIGGSIDGKKIDRIEYQRALAMANELADWDENGKLRKSGMGEPSLDWVAEKFA